MSYVGKGAFSKCNNLEYFEYYGIISPKYDNGVFDDCPKLNEIKVPENYKESTFCGKKVLAIEPSKKENQIGLFRTHSVFYRRYSQKPYQYIRL